MPLEISTFLALASACAPTVAPATLLAVARVESGLDPLAIGVNGPTGVSSRARTPSEAIQRAEALIAGGRDIDLGLGQINVRTLRRLGLSIADAFDPCRNLAASARVLAEGYRRAAPNPGREQQALRTALSFYNTGHPERGLRNGYVTRVVAMAARARDQVDAPAPPPPAPAPWDVFGGAKVVQSFVITPASGAQP